MAQAKGDIAGHGQMGEQSVVLEHHADAPSLRRHGYAGSTHDLAVQGDRSAQYRFKAGNAAQNGGFAAAAGAEQAGDRPGFDMKTHPLQYGRVFIGVGDVIEIKTGWHAEIIPFCC